MASSSPATEVAAPTLDTSSERVWKSIMSAGSLVAVASMASAGMTVILTSPLANLCRAGATACTAAALQHVLVQMPPPREAAGIATSLAYLCSLTAGGGVSGIGSICVAMPVVALHAVGISAWKAADAAAAGTAATAAAAGPSSECPHQGGSVAAGFSGGCPDSASGRPERGAFRPPNECGAGVDRSWLAAVFGARVAALCVLFSSLFRSLDEQHEWWTVLLAIVTVGMDVGLLVVLCPRVVLPASKLANSGLFQSVEFSVDWRRCLNSATAPGAVSGRTLDWRAAGRFLAWNTAISSFGVFSFFAAPGVIFLTLLGVVVCLPAATPLPVVTIIVGMGVLVGIALISSAFSGSTNAVRGPREECQAGDVENERGGGPDVFPSVGVPLVQRPLNSPAAA